MKKKKIVFFLRFFLPLISRLTRKFYSFRSDNEIRVHCSLDRSRSSLSDFFCRKKFFFFHLLSDLLILIFSVVILYAHWVSGNEIK